MIKFQSNEWVDSGYAKLEIFACENGDVVGRLAVSAWGENVVTVDDFAVFRGRGKRHIEQSLVRELVTMARFNPTVEEIAVAVSKADPARITLFKSAGFEEAYSIDNSVGLLFSVQSRAAA